MARKPTPKILKNNDQLHLKTNCTALYIRVSTEKQVDEGYSMEAQERRLRAYCEAQGWNVCEQHIYSDAGVSGKSTANRGALNAVMHSARNGDIDRIVAMKLDRIARNVKDFLAIVDELKMVECNLVLISESFDTGTPHGRFALTMFAAMAELEASTITERVMSGKQQKSLGGGYNGAQCPLGYDYADGVFTPNGDADTVRFVFDRWLASDSMLSIANQLNDSGTPTQRGGRWSHTTVRYILLNGFYAGLSQWDGVEVTGDHPAIVGLAGYQAAFARVEAAKRGNPNFGKRSQPCEAAS